MKVILILSVIVLIVNILSLDFNNLLDLNNNNKTTIINIIVMILIVLTSFYKKNFVYP